MYTSVVIDYSYPITPTCIQTYILIHLLSSLLKLRKIHNIYAYRNGYELYFIYFIICIRRFLNI